MKKVSLILALSILSIVAVAQKPFAIYDWKGKVLIKEYKTQQWLPAQKDQPVNGLDSVIIDPNSVLRVIDTRSNLIYKSTSAGKMRVLNIINDAKKQNSNTLAAVNRELLYRDKNSSNTPTMQMVGATTRGSDNEALMDSIIQTFGWLANMAIQDQLNTPASGLLLKRHDTPDGIWFEMQNLSAKNYYVNVLHVNKGTKKVNLCYVIEQSEEPEMPFLYLPHGEQLQLKNLVFSLDSSTDIYILVGTEDQYIPEQIQSSLQHLDIETAKPLYKKYKFFKQ